MLKLNFRLDSSEEINMWPIRLVAGKSLLTVSLASSFCRVGGSYLSPYTKLIKTMLELEGLISMELKGGVSPKIASGTIRWSHQI